APPARERSRGRHPVPAAAPARRQSRPRRSSPPLPPPSGRCRSGSSKSSSRHQQAAYDGISRDRLPADATQALGVFGPGALAGQIILGHGIDARLVRLAVQEGVDLGSRIALVLGIALELARLAIGIEDAAVDAGTGATDAV